MPGHPQCQAQQTISAVGVHLVAKPLLLSFTVSGPAESKAYRHQIVTWYDLEKASHTHPNFPLKSTEFPILTAIVSHCPQTP